MTRPALTVTAETSIPGKRPKRFMKRPGARGRIHIGWTKTETALLANHCPALRHLSGNFNQMRKSGGGLGVGPRNAGADARQSVPHETKISRRLVPG